MTSKRCSKHPITKKSRKRSQKRVTALRKNHVKTSPVKVAIVLDLGRATRLANTVGPKMTASIDEKVVLRTDIVVAPETDIRADALLKTNGVVRGLLSNYPNMDHLYLLRATVENHHLWHPKCHQLVC